MHTNNMNSKAEDIVTVKKRRFGWKAKNGTETNNSWQYSTFFLARMCLYVWLPMDTASTHV